MDACGTKARASWPQLSIELKLEILWHLLAVDVGKEEQEVTRAEHYGIRKDVGNRHLSTLKLIYERYDSRPGTIRN